MDSVCWEHLERPSLVTFSQSLFSSEHLLVWGLPQVRGKLTCCCRAANKAEGWEGSCRKYALQRTPFPLAVSLEGQREELSEVRKTFPG